ncbi:MAG: hypothetical protein ABH839_00180 [Chloroflexota bacterium]
MTTVNSVLGPLDSRELGFTLMHEHIILASPGFIRNYPELLEADPLGRAVSALKEANAGGVDTILDATTLDLGRDVELVAEASRLSGVNIIACTGSWQDIPRFFAGVSADQLAEVFIREIEEGISGTAIKAGMLKGASDMMGVTPQQEIVLLAIAQAHLKTGVPIMLHSYSPGRVGAQQLAILKEAGVKAGRVKMDHSNDTTDIEYLLWLLEQGCYLGMDRYPGRNASPLARTKTMKALIDAGYAGRLCPAHDWAAACIRTDDPDIPGIDDLNKLNPHGYLYIKKVVFPQLREMGVAVAIIDSLCTDGPRNFFEGI